MDIRPIIVEVTEEREGVPVEVLIIDPFANCKTYKRLMGLPALGGNPDAVEPYMVTACQN